MLLRRRGGYAERARDLLVRRTTRDQCHDLSLTRRQGQRPSRELGLGDESKAVGEKPSGKGWFSAQRTEDRSRKGIGHECGRHVASRSDRESVCRLVIVRCAGDDHGRDPIDELRDQSPIWAVISRHSREADPGEVGKPSAPSDTPQCNAEVRRSEDAERYPGSVDDKNAARHELRM